LIIGRRLTGEADVTAMHVEKLISSGLSQDNIAVISPYNLQVLAVQCDSLADCGSNQSSSYTHCSGLDCVMCCVVAVVGRVAESSSVAPSCTPRGEVRRRIPRPRERSCCHLSSPLQRYWLVCLSNLQLW